MARARSLAHLSGSFIFIIILESAAPLCVVSPCGPATSGGALACVSRVPRRRRRRLTSFKKNDDASVLFQRNDNNQAAGIKIKINHHCVARR